jgi:hypothetical protein
MSEIPSPITSHPYADPYINRTIEDFLSDYAGYARNEDKAIFKAETDQGRRIELAALKWEASKEADWIDLSKRLRALRLVRYLSKVAFMDDSNLTQTIDLGTGDEKGYWWGVDRYCQHYIEVQTHNQNGTYYGFEQPAPGQRSCNYTLVATARNHDFYKRVVMAEGEDAWKQVHSQYLAAPIPQRAEILPQD